MKKLLFAIAGAASFAALAADPTPGANDIDVLGFENFDLTDTANVTGAVVGRTDSGIEGQGKWSCSGDDASLVKTYGGDNAAKGNGLTFPGPFEDEGDQYLALDTNGAELQRAVGATVAADGTYIDTLVQFTPSESAPTSTDLAGAKLAIWLGVVENVTNLYVQGNSWDIDEGFQGTEQAFALSGKTIEPGTWYRLTVKAIPNVLGSDTGSSISAFQISVDGTDMTLAASPFSADMLTTLAEYGAAAWASADIQTAFAANKLVPAIQEEIGTAGDPLTLASVGFKGTGALDDFVVTTEAPDFTPAAIDFTLTWPNGYTPVSYTINGGEAVSLTGETSGKQFSVPAGSIVAFTFQNADGALKTSDPVTASTEANSINAADTTFTWADYLGEAVDGAYEIDNLAELKLFQKGVANTNELTTANTTFKLTANITLDAPWPGIGLQNGKDVYKTQQFNDEAFLGTFDGQNYTISGFQMQGGGLDYCGFFNSTYGATIQNLKIQYAGALFAADTTQNSSLESGATFVGVAKNSTLRNLTTVAGTVSCDKGFGGIVGYLTTGTLVDSCTNNVNMTSLKPNKCGGIAMITQGGTTVTIRDCQNNGTVAGSGEIGSLIGYIGNTTVVERCESTVAYKLFQHQDSPVTISGVTAVASVDPYTGAATPGLNFATVDGSVATFVDDGALAAGNTYKVMHTAAATYEFTAAGSISFDTNMIQAVTFAITAAQDLKGVTETTESGVVTFTAAAYATPTVTVNGGANATATWTVNGAGVASAPATLREGDTYEVFYTANDGYEFAENAVTNASGAAGTENIVITIADAVMVAPAYPTYVGEDATLKTQYDTWKTTNGADSQSAYEKQFLLNVAPGTTVADDALVIESITENETSGWDIVVSTTVSGAALSANDATTYNGYLLVKAANDLAGLATATPVAYPVTAVTGGKVSITVTAGKFMKVVLTTTAPAQN